MGFWHVSVSLGLFIFMSSSFIFCLILGMMPKQMECLHSGISACSMRGDDCCLTESGKASARNAELRYQFRVIDASSTRKCPRNVYIDSLLDCIIQ